MILWKGAAPQGYAFRLFVACLLLWRGDKAILPKGKDFKGLLLLLFFGRIAMTNKDALLDCPNPLR